MKTLALLLLSTLAASSATITSIDISPNGSLPRARPDQIEFRVAFDAYFNLRKKVEGNLPISIYCSWTNVSPGPVSIVLKDHDARLGTLAYVYGIRVRITAEDGEVLTSPAQGSDGWWAHFGSVASPLMPGDIVTIPPGETVTRRFELKDILRGLPFECAMAKAPKSPDGSYDISSWTITDFVFPVGTSTIEVRFEDLIAQAPLKFRVAPAGNGRPIEDASSAIQLAMPALAAKYGDSEVKRRSPFRARLVQEDGKEVVWVIEGDLPETARTRILRETYTAIVRQRDGRILDVSR